MEQPKFLPARTASSGERGEFARRSSLSKPRGGLDFSDSARYMKARIYTCAGMRVYIFRDTTYLSARSYASSRNVPSVPLSRPRLAFFRGSYAPSALRTLARVRAHATRRQDDAGRVSRAMSPLSGPKPSSCTRDVYETIARIMARARRACAPLSTAKDAGSRHRSPRASALREAARRLSARASRAIRARGECDFRPSD
jgi:hypothetical protein